jgi:hypothetical protein
VRILFLHHFPLDESPVSRLVQSWTAALRDAGHDVRILIVDERLSTADDPAVRRILCGPSLPQAELTFGLPRFESASTGPSATTFANLPEPQLIAYRDALRRHLDAEVDAFDPHILHAQHLWIWGQLALETGIPYVLNGWEPELIEYARGERYRRWVDQAVENASWILTPDAQLRQKVIDTFDAVDQTLAVAPPLLPPREGDPATDPREISERLIALYEGARLQRFG